MKIRDFKFFHRFTVNTDLTSDEIKKRLLKVMAPYKMFKWSYPPERYEGRFEGNTFKMRRITGGRGAKEVPIIKGVIRNSTIDFSAEAWKILSSAIWLIVTAILLIFLRGTEATGDMKFFFLCLIFVFVIVLFFMIPRYIKNLAKDKIFLKELFRAK